MTNRDVNKWLPELSDGEWHPSLWRSFIHGVGFASTREKAEQVCALLNKWGVQ